MKHSYIIKIILALLLSVFTINQEVLKAELNSENKSDNNNNLTLKKATFAYQNFDFSIAAVYYEDFMKNHSNISNEVLSKLADCYWQMRAYRDALRVYNLLYRSENQEVSMQDKIRISELYARIGQYTSASNWLNGVAGYSLKAKIYNEKESLDAMKKDSLNWKLGFLNINTSYREFSPFVANSTLFFSSNKQLTTRTKAFGWDGDNFVRLWQIPLKDVYNIPQNRGKETIIVDKVKYKKSNNLAGIYECSDTKPMKSAFGLLINDQYLNGASNSIGNIVRGFEKISGNTGTVSIDKNNHFYFSANYGKADNHGNVRICLMEGVYSQSGVTSVHKLPFGDAKSYNVMHPAINKEGTFIVCSSNKTNGLGAYDLYYSKRSDIHQPWDSLKAFGANINTIGNEVFPGISTNGYLYFSSDGRPGLGGLDIFRITLSDALAGQGTPEHLSYPINSSSDDFGWSQSDSLGIKGFITSDRLNDNDNIYSFSDESALRFPRRSFIEGYVIEKQSGLPISGATIFMYNVKENSVYVAKSDNYGKYHIPVLNTTEIVIKAVHNKYLNDCLSSQITYEPQPTDTIQHAPRALLLDKFKVGFVWNLNNIHYYFDKWNIRQDAMPILDSLVKILNEQPINVELASHTDSRGSSEYNILLSKRRAESTVAYLIQHGIDPKRITSKYFGKSKLLNRCNDNVPCTEAEHEANRRTEVKVTGYTTPINIHENIELEQFRDGDKIDKKILPADFFMECIK